MTLPMQNTLNTSEAAIALFIAKMRLAGIDDSEIAGSLLAAGALVALHHTDAPHTIELLANLAEQVAEHA